MTVLKRIALCLLVALSLTNCFEDNDDNLISASEINDFIWKGMNVVYLYKDEIPDLADNRFSSNEEYATYLNSFDTPEAIFESLIYQPETVDKFSVLIDNYFEFQQQQQGTNLSNGLRFQLFLKPGSDADVFGAIILVVNGSPAATAGLMRGQYFDSIDGISLNTSNFGALLSQDSYTLNMANYNDNGTEMVDDDTITANGESVALAKIVLTENPVHKAEVLTVDNQKIGYLMYNRFTSNFDSALNNAFSLFDSENVQHLVIDLRYNPGGSVQTAAYLGSMVTGQFTGDVFSKLIYNSTLQELNRDVLFTSSIEDGPSINSLNLDKVYILTQDGFSASATELVINSLDAYINVVQVGENTVGKTQASITVYDSPNLQFEDVNPNHTYAMQPLVANSINVNDQAVPSTGLTPDINYSETPRNYGTLGDPDEPLLAAAIADILGTGRFISSPDAQNQQFEKIKIPKQEKYPTDIMYIER